MELLTRCRDLALPFYVDLLKSAQLTLRERLFEQAQRAAGADPGIFSEAARRLDDSAGAMRQAFEARLQRGYRLFLAGREQEPPAPAAAPEQLEDDLAISLIVSRANSQHAGALWQLNRRLAALRGGRPVLDDGNPFGPALVGAALRAAMAELEVASKARIFIYRHLGKLLLAVFGRVFAALNETLAAAGVLPNLRFAADESAADQAGGADGDRHPPADADARQACAAILERLRQGRGGSRAHTAAGISYGGLATGRDGAAANFLPLDYALVLSALQQAPEFAAGAALLRPLTINAVEERLFRQLGRQARADARHQLAEGDADTVDLVGLIFRYLLDDPKLPDPVKSLLSHLHTPYLKLALLDRRLLQDETHPARRLLDRMAELGARWVTDDKERLVLPKLRSVVDTVLRGFIDDASLFERLLEDFDGFCDSLDKRAGAVEKRNREAQEGIERLAQARARAAQAIDERIRGRAVAEGVLRLLQQPWTDYLAFNELRNGENSRSWQAALKVVDGVLWSVQADAGRSREALQRLQEQLDQAIAEGLRTIGWRSEGAEQLLGALREAQELALQGRAPAAPSPPPAAAAAEPPLSDAARQCAEQLRCGVDFGNWFEFDRPGGQPPQALKLAWFSRASGHYLFVNQAGVKQRLETLPALAQQLAEGRVRRLRPERKAFVERALAAILDSLRGGG